MNGEQKAQTIFCHTTELSMDEFIIKNPNAKVITSVIKKKSTFTTIKQGKHFLPIHEHFDFSKNRAGVHSLN